MVIFPSPTPLLFMVNASVIVLVATVFPLSHVITGLSVPIMEVPFLPDSVYFSSAVLPALSSLYTTLVWSTANI